MIADFRAGTMFCNGGVDCSDMSEDQGSSNARTHPVLELPGQISLCSNLAMHIHWKIERLDGNFD